MRDVVSFLDDLRLESAAMSAPAPSPALEARLERPTARVLRTVEAFARPRTRMNSRLRPVVALCAASCVTFGSLAAAGALPGPLQHASARFGSHFGIGIPGATRTRAVPPVDAASAAAGSTPEPNAAGPWDVERSRWAEPTPVRAPVLASSDEAKASVSPLPIANIGSSPLPLSLSLEVLPSALDPRNVARAVRHGAGQESPADRGQQRRSHRPGLSRIWARKR